MKEFTCYDCGAKGVFKSLKAAHQAGWEGNPDTTETEYCPDCVENHEDWQARQER